MTEAATGPIVGDLVVYLDTDNPFDLPIVDRAGVRLDVLTWAADFKVDTDETHTATKLTVAVVGAPDPEDGTKSVLHWVLTDDLLQPGDAANQWPVTETPKTWPYSVKRTDDGLEKIVRRGRLIVKRARE
jgi:hypothetical protein